MKSYKYIIFDLDHTLWDFERNARETLEFLFDNYNLDARSIKSNKERFVKSYFRVNRAMWKLYDKSLITKDEIRSLRFQKVLKDLNVRDQHLALELETNFLKICPARGHLIAGALDLLNYLDGKYELHLLTNGFLETQNIKIETSKIAHFFKSMTTSECSGYKKPDPKIFHFKLDKIQANKEECIMVGDNLLTDIGGARRSGVDQLFFNPTRMKHNDKVTYEVSELSQIKDIL